MSTDREVERHSPHGFAINNIVRNAREHHEMQSVPSGQSFKHGGPPTIKTSNQLTPLKN
jgi:hypothetical protein